MSEEGKKASGGIGDEQTAEHGNLVEGWTHSGNRKDCPDCNPKSSEGSKQHDPRTRAVKVAAALQAMALQLELAGEGIPSSNLRQAAKAAVKAAKAMIGEAEE